MLEETSFFSRYSQKNDVKITYFRRYFFLQLLKNWNGDKEIVKATKNDRYFIRYSCGLYWNKA